MTAGPRLLWAAAALMVAACSTPASTPPSPAAPVDPARARLLGALPPEEAARGVYVVDLDAPDALNPGSRIAPLIAGIADQADLLVETAAPPVTLLSGVPAGSDTPGGDRVDDVLVIGGPEVRAAAVARLESGAAPDGALAELAATSAPVAWSGPTPTSGGGTGTTLVTLSPDAVQITVDPDTGLAGAAEFARNELAEGAPPGSPGKPWRSILGDPEVTTVGDRLVITATPVDLPGLFLRALLDQRHLTFLQG